MAKNEEIVEQQERENAAAADRVNYTHRLVGMHEAAPPVQVPAGHTPEAPPQAPPPPMDQADGHAAAAPPAEQAPAESAASAGASDEAPLRCPHCGATNPAAMNRSDGRQCYRCDRCAWQWGAPHADTAEDDVPPIPSIDAPGG